MLTLGKTSNLEQWIILLHVLSIALGGCSRTTTTNGKKVGTENKDIIEVERKVKLPSMNGPAGIQV